MLKKLSLRKTSILSDCVGVVTIPTKHLFLKHFQPVTVYTCLSLQGAQGAIRSMDGVQPGPYIRSYDFKLWEDSYP